MEFEVEILGVFTEIEVFSELFKHFFLFWKKNSWTIIALFLLQLAFL